MSSRMRQQPDINIQEPPVTELKKQRSCLKRSCFSGCGCIVFFFIAILVLLNMVTGTGTKEVKHVPDVAPDDIAFYEIERVKSIRISDKPVRGQVATMLAIVPKSILATTYLALGEDSPETISKYYDAVEFTDESALTKFQRLLNEPLTPERQHIEMVWYFLNAEPRFIQEFYVTELEKADYALTITAASPLRRQILFEKGEVIGSILIQDADTNQQGTDQVSMKISLPLE